MANKLLQVKSNEEYRGSPVPLGGQFGMEQRDIPDGPPPVRVVVADDDPHYRDALIDLLSAEPDLECVGAASDAAGAIEVACSTGPDVVLLDVNMPGGGGHFAAGEISRRLPQGRVLALSAHEDRASVVDMLRAGACGYVVKGSPGKRVVEAIHRASAGQAVIAPEISGVVLDELVGLLDQADELSRELVAIDRQKSELVQILSHELLTPVTVVQTAAAVLKGRHGTPLPPEILQAVDRAGRRLQQIVRNIYVTASLQRGGQLARVPVSVEELVRLAVEDCGPKRDGVRVSIEDDGLIVCNTEMAVRALVLLLDNALRFSPPDTPVGIRCATLEGFVEIAVEDRGLGVEPGDRERIFEVLTQADSSESRAHQGIGLGLGLVRLIMDAHGGTAGFREPDGTGSIFFLRFPAAPSGARGGR